MQKFNIVEGEQIIENYPYYKRRLRCTMCIFVDFNPLKGYRLVKKTLDKETGLYNKPHIFKYQHFVCLYLNKWNYTKHLSFMLHNEENFYYFLRFIKEHNNTFTEQQSIYLWNICITCLEKSMRNARPKVGFSDKDLLEIMQVPKLKEFFRKKENFSKIKDISFDLKEFHNSVIIKNSSLFRIQ